MAHNRKAIRDAVVSVITGLPSTGASVFSGRVYDLQESDLPCVEVATHSEEVEYISATHLREQERSLIIEIIGRVQAASGYEDLLDTLAKEIELAIEQSALLGDLIVNYTLQHTQMHFDGANAKTIGKVILTYAFTYYSREGV